LPGHRLLLKGRGLEAVRLNLFGSLFALISSSLLLIPVIFILPIIYSFLKSKIFFILVGISLFMVLREKNKFLGLLIFLLSGFLGFFTLESSVNEPFLPLLTGFFGISTLLISIKDVNFIPVQDINASPSISAREFFSAGLLGQVSGFFISILPGLGSSVAAAVSMRFIGDSEDAFLILTGCINTVNFIFSLATFYTIDKARNGSIIVLKELFSNISFFDVLFFLSVILVSGCMAFLITLWTSKYFCKFIQRLNYRGLVVFVIAFLVFLVCLFSGFKGFIILLIAVCIGITPALGLTSRSLCIACILLPVMLFFQKV
jgi:putative membrane protein